MPPLQYVILRHEDIAQPHFDLMFETYPGSELTTWRSPRWPVAGKTPLTRVKDHRRVYLDYEGELTARRGRVLQVARGTCAVAVGENAVWGIRLLTGSPPQTLTIRQIDAEKWEVIVN